MKANYQEVTQTIEPDARVVINRAAQFITVLDASDDFQIDFDDGTPSAFRKGLTYRPPNGFTSVGIKNNTAASITVRMGFGVGEIFDAQLAISGSIETREKVRSEFDTGVVTVPAGGTAQIAATSSTRAELIIMNRDATQTVQLHSANTASANGLDVGAGLGFVLGTTAEVWAYNAGAAPVEISWATVGGF